MNPVALEKHYSPTQVALMWGVSESTVRRLFEDQPGVLKISMPRLIKSKRKHRPHVRLSIPESVLARVHEQWTGTSEKTPQRRSG